MDAANGGGKASRHRNGTLLLLFVFLFVLGAAGRRSGVAPDGRGISGGAAAAGARRAGAGQDQVGLLLPRSLSHLL